MRMKNFIAVMGAVAIMISGGVPPLNLYASEAAVVPAPAEQQLVIPLMWTRSPLLWKQKTRSATVLYVRRLRPERGSR